MTREVWRYIDSGPLPGAQNMAIDEAMLESHLRGETPPTLRVYTWRPPAISLGRFQAIETSVNLEECRRAGVDVVRRPTGGRAILHTEQEVTFSIVVSEARLGVRGVMDSYRLLAGAIVAGLKQLGLDVRLVERSSPAVDRSSPGVDRSSPGVDQSSPGGPSASQDPACFAVKARCDLQIASKKLVGSAQLHRNGVILQQNSLPLRIPLDDWSRFFLRPARNPAATGLWDIAPLPPLRVGGALRRGFEEGFGVELADGGLTASEVARAAELAAGEAARSAELAVDEVARTAELAAGEAARSAERTADDAARAVERATQVGLRQPGSQT